MRVSRRQNPGWLLLVVGVTGAVSGDEILSGGVGAGGGAVSGGGGRAVVQVCVGDAFSGGIAKAGGIEDKGGYTGLLYDVVGLELDSGVAAGVPEGGTTVLGAKALMDDETSLAVPAGDVAWGILEGPLESIGAGGLLVAGPVYEDTPARLEAGWRGGRSEFGLEVLDVDSDNFGSYAGDGIGDDWQVSFFGVGNPDGGAGVDADGDSQDNLLEFLALVDPTDALSFFEFEVVDAGVVRFAPVFGERRYTLFSGGDPDHLEEVAGGEVVEAEGWRTVTEPGGGGVRRFYQVRITNEP